MAALTAVLSLPPSPGGLGFGLLAGAAWFSTTSALEFDICASINTATMPGNHSYLQTNGLCHDRCFDNYAYAVTQDFLCWCSNYTPDEADQVSGSECNIPCPAYPDEHCGGPDAYSYVLLNNVVPSGTIGGESSTTTTTSTSTSTTPTEVC
jgi:cell wall integrity and stress response component